MISEWVLLKNEFIPVATWYQSKNLFEKSHFWVSLLGFSSQNETLILDDVFYLYSVNTTRLSYLYESSLGAREALKKTGKDILVFTG